MHHACIRWTAGELQRCLVGDDGGVLAGCDDVDVEPDGDTDLDDYAHFLETFIGPED